MKAFINCNLLLFLCILRDASSLSPGKAIVPRSAMGDLLSKQEDPNRKAVRLYLSGGAAAESSASNNELQDYSGPAASLFGNLRIPAALFAGAAAGSAFAMPLSPTDGLKFGLAKRIYALLMMGSLSAEIITIVVSTLAMGSMTVRPTELTKSTRELLANKYDFEWVSARLHFLMGILFFAIGTGMRAWVSISCPVFALSAVGLIASSTLFCLAVIDEREREGGSSLLAVPFKFLKLMLTRIKSDFLFGLSFALATATGIYILLNVPHIYHYLIAK